MITISRTDRSVSVDGRRVRLTPTEYQLMTTLGCLDVHLIPHDLLMDLVFDHPVRLDRDKEMLRIRLSRLRSKVGRNVVRCIKGVGYQVTEPVQFQ